MKNKFKIIVLVLLYYIFIIIGGVYNFLFGLFFGIIGNTSLILFNMLYIICPILLFLLPVMLYLKFKTQYKKIILCSYIALTIFIILLFSIFFGLKSYFSKFSQEKWEKYSANRYYMINDLENSYKVIGKNKQEVIELLGNNYIENTDQSAIMYDIQYSLVSVQYYILYYDNNIVIDTELQWLD